MNLVHPPPLALDLYTIGAHDEIVVPDIEAHLRVCESCTEEVRRQAQIDLALVELAAEAVFCPGCSGVLVTARCQRCGAVAEVQGFRVEKVLVQNAHGRMYLAKDPSGQPVALKELAFVQAPHPDALAAFEREARLLRQLSHPQIPRFLAAFSDGEGVNTRLYLAQEFVEGESLLARLEHHQYAEEEAVEVARQVLGILEYLQSLAPMVFHRDIKPANLIRRPDGRIALVDFGAARDLGATVGATLVGTFGYMPIEQMGGIVDATTDPYALACTLCHLLSRREPWTFLEDPSALERLNVSSRFRGFLQKLLARRPADRHPSAAAARAMLGASVRRSWRACALPRLRSPTYLAFSVFGVALGGAMLFLSRPNREPAVPATAMEFGVGPPSELPPGEARLRIRPEEAPHRPRLPASLVGSGAQISVLVKICVSTQGDVSDVKIIANSHREMAPEFDRAFRTWKYQPVVIAGHPVAFCTNMKYTLTAR